MEEIDVKGTLMQYWDYDKEIPESDMRIVQEQNFAEKGSSAKEKMIELSKVDEIYGTAGAFILHGDYLASQNISHYKRYNIQYIINTYGSSEQKGEHAITYPEGLNAVLNIRLPDNLADMKKTSPVIISFIKMALSTGSSVLIYCKDGTPYSLVAILIFLYDAGFNTNKALTFLGKKIARFSDPAEQLTDYDWLLKAY